MLARVSTSCMLAMTLVASASAQDAATDAGTETAMDDGRGFAVGVGLDLVGLDGASQDAFDEDPPVIGVSAFLRHDVWRPGDAWALGLFVVGAHHSEGHGAEPPNAAQVLQNATSGAGQDETVAPIAAQRFTNTLLAGLELRHGLLPWLIPFVHAGGGVAFVAADFTDPNDCASSRPLQIPGLQLPEGIELPELCTAYRVHHDSATAPVLQATLGLTLRPSTAAGSIVASPFALSIEGGYVAYGKTSLAADGTDDAQLAERLTDLDPSSWLVRVSLHAWF